LVKVSSGTLTLSGANTYSGETTVSAGTLAISGTSAALSDTAALRIASGATVNLASGVNETVNMLYLGAAQMAAGTWGSTSSSADNQDDVYFSGDGILTVVVGGVSGTTFRFR
jgi:autotransporter-associated beta strand protein